MESLFIHRFPIMYISQFRKNWTVWLVLRSRVTYVFFSAVSNCNEIFYSSQRHVDLFDLVSDLKKEAIKAEKSKEKDKDRAQEKGKRVTEKGKKRSKEREDERRVKEKIVKMKDVEQEKGKEEEVLFVMYCTAARSYWVSGRTWMQHYANKPVKPC